MLVESNENTIQHILCDILILNVVTATTHATVTDHSCIDNSSDYFVIRKCSYLR